MANKHLLSVVLKSTYFSGQYSVLEDNSNIAIITFHHQSSFFVLSTFDTRCIFLCVHKKTLIKLVR